MGERFMRWARLALLCARNIPRGKVVSLERGARIACDGCAVESFGTKRTRIGPQGVWTGDVQAPDGWGIRYTRHTDSDPTPSYYCGKCSALVSAGKMKV